MTPTQKNQNNEHELKYLLKLISSPTLPQIKNEVRQHMFWNDAQDSFLPGYFVS